MNTQYRKNLKDVATACKNYTDNQIAKAKDDLRWELGTYDLSVDSDTTSAYQKIVPANSIEAKINTLGGMSYKVNQLAVHTSLTFSSDDAPKITTVFNLISGNKYLFTLNQNKEITTSTRNMPVLNVDGIQSITNYGTASGTLSLGISENQNVSSGNKYALFTCSTTVTGNLLYWLNNPSASYDIIISNINIFNLTQDFGSGNEPNTIEACASAYLQRGIDIYGNNEYNVGSIRDTKITSVVSKDSNLTTIDTLSINASIQALDGYGWGINDTCYNYVDFNAKKFVKKVARVDLGSLEWFYDSVFIANISNIKKSSGFYAVGNLLTANYTAVSFASLSSVDKSICVLDTVAQIRINNSAYTDATAFKTAMSGVYLYYELATPVETDISSYLTTNKITVEGNGTLTMENTYGASIPSDVDYLIEEVKA